MRMPVFFTALLIAGTQKTIYKLCDFNFSV